MFPTRAVLSIFNVFDGPSTAYEALYIMLNAEDEQEQDELTKNWRDHKLEELNFVGTLVRSLDLEHWQFILTRFRARCCQVA